MGRFDAARHLLRPAAVSIICVALLLTGCTDTTSIASPPPSSPADSERTTEPIIEVSRKLVDVPEGTVVGTATFQSDRYDVSGSLEVVSTPRTPVGDTTARWTIRLTDLTLPAQFSDPSLFRLVAEPYSGDWPCIGSWGGEAIAQADVANGDGTLLLGLGTWPASTDPSWLDSLLILDAATETPDANGCSYPVAVRADIEWSMPDVRPWLSVRAGEVLPHAAGGITLEDGVPVSYDVVGRDSIEAVAERLGITVDDIHFLNPARQNATSTGREILVAGERLNLAKDRR